MAEPRKTKPRSARKKSPRKPRGKRPSRSTRSRTSSRRSKSRPPRTAPKKASEKPERSADQPLTAASIRDLAAKVGRSYSTVRGWINRSAWPFAPRPPWDVLRVIAWARANLTGDSNIIEGADGQDRQRIAKLSPLNKAKLALYTERAKLIRQQRLREAGELHDVAECQRRRLEQIHAVRTALLELARSLAPDLVRRGRAEIEQRIAAAHRQVLVQLAGDEFEIDSE